MLKTLFYTDNTKDQGTTYDLKQANTNKQRINRSDSGTDIFKDKNQTFSIRYHHMYKLQKGLYLCVSYEF